jgi:hypothetical protein
VKASAAKIVARRAARLPAFCERMQVSFIRTAGGRLN